MAKHRFVIAKYRVSISPGAAAGGGIVFDRWLECDTITDDGRKHSCTIYFLTKESQTKPHSFRQLSTRIRVVLYFPEDLYQTVIELLRVGQRPIEIQIDSDRPENARIRSTIERMRHFDRTLLVPKP